jgi:hypothetical protein
MECCVHVFMCVILLVLILLGIDLVIQNTCLLGIDLVIQNTCLLGIVRVIGNICCLDLKLLF